MTHPTKAIYKWLIQDSVRVQYVTDFWSDDLADFFVGVSLPPPNNERPSILKPTTFQLSPRSRPWTSIPRTLFPPFGSRHTLLAMS